jgi:hypothetical protein
MLKDHGHAIAIVHILKMDTTGRLESIIVDRLSSGELQSNGNGLENGSETTATDAPTATDAQKAMTARALENPLSQPLIGTISTLTILAASQMPACQGMVLRRPSRRTSSSVHVSIQPDSFSLSSSIDILTDKRLASGRQNSRRSALHRRTKPGLI